LVTGYDIIFFWVARMIFSALENTGKAPFEHVFIHGLVRDELGRKMSKSLGNGIDPLKIIDQYGGDALRYALITGNSPGNDMRFSTAKVEAARNFANKLWNASRFALMNLTIEKCELPGAADMALEDKWLISKLNTLCGEVTANLDKFELGVALAKIYDFVWDILCDWYIELIKPRLNEGDLIAQNVLCYALRETLKLLHPFMPFITEEIYQAIPHDCESIMIAKYPSFSEKLVFPAEEERMAALIDAITRIRTRRTEMNVAPSKKSKVIIVTEAKDIYNDDTEHFFRKLASASDVIFAPHCSDENVVQIVAPKANIYIPLGDLVDFAKERARLGKEREKCLSEIDRVTKKLANEGFVAKAPAQLIESEKAKKVKLEEQLKSIDEALAKLK
ncbi:MAG: class I tRNA ligase family protein, partial [Candidatus Flemingiibacterium sp.]